MENTKSRKITERASELEYLTWFRINADFGPAESEVIYYMDREFMRETGKLLPKGWESEE